MGTITPMCLFSHVCGMEVIMSSSKLIKLALLFIVVGSVMFFAGRSLGGSGFYIDNRFHIKSFGTDEYFEYSNMELDAFTDIKVDIRNCPITVKKSEDGHYGVSVKLYSPDSGSITAEVNGHTLTVKGNDTFRWILWDVSLGLTRQEEYVIIYLPEADYGKFELATSNASINLAEISGKAIAAETSNGSVTAADLTVTESLDIETSNASITTVLSGAENDYKIEADTSNANVYINSRKEGREYKSKNGSIKLNLETSNGTINLTFQ